MAALISAGLVIGGTGAAAEAKGDVEKKGAAAAPLPGETPEDLKVRTALDQTLVSVDFRETPAAQAVETLAKLAKLNIVLDRRILFLRPEVRVTLTVKDVPLGRVLRLVAQQTEMLYVVRGGVVFLSDEEGLREPPVREVYDVADLAAPRVGQRPPPQGRTAEEVIYNLMDLIRQTVEPGTWDEGSGNSAHVFEGRIVIVHTPQVQRKVRELLAELRRTRGLAAKVPPGEPARPAPPEDRPEARKLRRALDETRVNVDFSEVPHLKALEQLARMGDINIVPDRARFEDPEAAVTLRLKDVSLGTALRLLVGQMGMEHAVRDGVVLVSDDEGLREPPVLAVYDVMDLLKQHLGEERRNPEEMLNDLIDLIKQTIEPGNWDEGSGNAIRGFENALVVRHTSDAQREVRELLAGLRRARAVGPNDPAAR